MERINSQPTFVDSLTAQLGGPRTSAVLERLDALIPWEQLAEPVRGLFSHGDRGGRRPWPAKLMLKCVLLQKWFGLSDPQLEEQLRDRLSFRRFVGLSLEDDTPDETTFVVFRRRLRQAKLLDELFERALRFLTEKGLVLQEGTLVDATIIEAPRGQSKKDKKGRTVGHTRDKDASYTKKNDRTYHGYKVHVATDKRGMIKRFVLDTAKVHDSQHFDALTKDERHAVWADSAYMSKKRKRDLDKRGVYCGIIARRVRGQKDLPRHQQLLNTLHAMTRAMVEHPFAWIKQMGWRRTRYRGKQRNGTDLGLMAIAYNFKRALSLLPT